MNSDNLVLVAIAVMGLVALAALSVAWRMTGAIDAQGRRADRWASTASIWRARAALVPAATDEWSRTRPVERTEPAARDGGALRGHSPRHGTAALVEPTRTVRLPDDELAPRRTARS